MGEVTWKLTDNDDHAHRDQKYQPEQNTHQSHGQSAAVLLLMSNTENTLWLQQVISQTETLYELTDGQFI